MRLRAWSDRRIGPFRRRVVLGKHRIELRAIQSRENLPLFHPVAVLSVDLDDREPIDTGGHLRFFARNQGSRDEQPIDEFAFDGQNHCHRRRLDRARLIDRSLGRRRAGGGLA